MDVLNERIEEEIEEEAGHGPSSPETNSMAGRVRVGNEGPHFLIEVRRGRGESRKPTFDVDLEAAMRINITSNAGFRLKVKILTSGVPQEG